MKLSLAIFLTLFLFANAYAQTTTPKPSQIHYNIHEKNPAISFILSTLIPGTGQMYNEEVDKGLGLFFGTAVCFTTSALIAKNNPDQKGGAIFFGVVGVGLYLYSMIDAPIISKQINSRNIDSFGMKGKTSLNVSITASNFPISLRYSF